MNYFSGVVKILENPRQYLIEEQTSILVFQAEVGQNPNNSILNLIVWGQLKNKVINFYKQNDYVLVEGYISIRNKQNSTILSLSQNFKQINVATLRLYPILLNSE